MVFREDVYRHTYMLLERVCFVEEGGILRHSACALHTLSRKPCIVLTMVEMASIDFNILPFFIKKILLQ